MNPPSQTYVSIKDAESCLDGEVNIDNQRKNMQPSKVSEDFGRLDGGRQAWMTVLGAWCCFFASYGFISSTGVFQNFYQSDMLASSSPSNIALILSLQIFTLSVLAPVEGWVFDNYGPRLLVSGGSFLVIFGLMMLSLSKMYYQIFLSQSICTGLGMGMIFHGVVNSVSTWFQKRRGLAVGLAASESGIGGCANVHPSIIMFDRLVGRIVFTWTVRTIAFVLIPMQTLAIFTVKSRLAHKTRVFNIADFIKPLKDVAFVLNSLACLFGMLGMLIPFNFLELSAAVSGVLGNITVYLLPMVNAGSMIGRIFPLWAGDHIGSFNITIFQRERRYRVRSLVWRSSGCLLSYIPALVTGMSDIKEMGYRVGTTFFINGVAGLDGNPIAGALIGAGGTTGADSFRGLKFFCGLAMVVSRILFVVTRVYLGSWKVNKKVYGGKFVSRPADDYTSGIMERRWQG
ncbi:putative MFS monocarboxylate transporter [Clohesyomyces aquaticus]|uniref:Putative MFS monocarboxylate transporter n=1 Tax=Clohesyomyces aquaticus TaxID=1231657 RepID=A0A1Y1ZIV0_9PLEO|nr:putative MFS monocarboxylate transporter [Clohesyomyces aquaticus]